MQTFYRGSAVLVLAAFISKSIEFLVNMILARELGEMGMGQYMSILPFIFLVVVIASLELPISISKYVAEKEETYHQSMLGHTFRLVIVFTVMLMLVVSSIFIMLPIFEAYHPLMKCLILLYIPVVSFSSITKGYLMGIRQMQRIAFANLLRITGQLILLIILFQLFQFELQTAVFIALFALFASELIVFIYLIYIYYLQTRHLHRIRGVRLSRKQVRQNLLAVSIPTTAMQLFHAFTYAIQPLLIRSVLINSGLTERAATEQFGLMAGVAMTIGFFPAFIAHSLMTILIPTVSKANANKEIATLRNLLQQVIIITILYGVPAIVIIYVFAEPLTSLFIDSPIAAYYLKILWPYFLVHFLVVPIQAFLIGLGLVKTVFYQTIWTTIISFLLMYYFGSLPIFRMDGVIIGMNTGGLLLLLMHCFTIKDNFGGSPFVRKSSNRSHW